MTNTSHSYSPTKALFDVGTIVTISMSDTKGRSISVRVMACSESPQVGTSYKVMEVPQGVDSSPAQPVYFFLKLPDPVPHDERQKLLERFEKEAKRGRELNRLIDDIEKAPLLKKSDIVFRLPRLIGAGRVDAVKKPDQENKAQPQAAIDGSEIKGLPVIIYQWIDGIELDRLSTKRINAIREYWFQFARALTEIVRRIHNHGMLHGHIVPRNILQDQNAESVFWLAGFGYSALSIEDAFSKGTAIPADSFYRAPEYGHSRALGALWHPADIYSIGAVIFRLALADFSSPLRNPATFGNSWIEVAELKEWVRGCVALASDAPNITSDVRKVLKNDNLAKIIDNCLRASPAERFEYVEELYDAIDLADSATGAEDGGYFEHLLARQQRAVKDFEVRVNQLPHFEIYGSRTKIIDGLCRMLGQLPDGAVYCTVTLPSYWTSENLGPDGRFLAMNKHVAKRGVRIERLFLVSGGIHSLPYHEQHILERQMEALSAVAGEGVKDAMEVKVLRVTPDEVRDFERSGQSVAFVAYEAKELDELNGQSDRAPLKKFLSLNFISRGEERRRYGKIVIEREIRKVRIWDPARGDSYWAKFLEESGEFRMKWDDPKARPLDEYLRRDRGIRLRELLERGRRDAA